MAENRRQLFILYAVKPERWYLYALDKRQQSLVTVTFVASPFNQPWPNVHHGLCSRSRAGAPGHVTNAGSRKGLSQYRRWTYGITRRCSRPLPTSKLDVNTNPLIKSIPSRRRTLMLQAQTYRAIETRRERPCARGSLLYKLNTGRH